MSEQHAERFQRAPSIRAFDRGDVTVVLGRDNLARELTGDSALLVRELLRFLVTPYSLTEIVAHFDEVAEGGSDARAAIEDALRVLREAGAVTHARPPAQVQRGAGRLVLGVTGAVAAAHTPLLVDKLLRRGFEVRVAMTRAATRFVSPDALRALTHRRVHRRLSAGSASAPAPHIELAEWADLVLIAPATATTLSRLAHGDCSDLVSAVTLATRAPIVVAPSMNVAMTEAAAIERNVAQLVDDGMYVLHPSVGIEVAEPPEARRPIFGAWPAVDDIVATVEHVRHQTRAVRTGVLPASESAAAWEGIYRETPGAQLPFHTITLDEDLREVLVREQRPSRLWDIGTGLGTVAREAARLGFQALGTDLSPRAIALASELAPERTQFAVDDIRRSGVEGTFDVVVDRGCFHTLDEGGARAYADAVQRRTRAGGLLAIKLHAPDEPRDWHTMRYRVADLEAVFAPHFTLTSWTASTIPGAIDPPARAWLAVFRRASAS